MGIEAFPPVRPMITASAARPVQVVVQWLLVFSVYVAASVAIIAI
jgi:hypothetical protein